MTRPAVLPDWATATNFAAGIATGQPNKVAPGAGNVTEGFDPGTKPPAEWFNFLINNHAAWINWLDSGSLSRAGIAALTGVVLGDRVFSRDTMTWYQYETPVSIYANDGIWTLASTGMGVGQWVAVPMLLPVAKIGPAPGDAFDSATTAGRLNKGVIDHGYWTHNYHPSVVATITRPFADPTTSADDLTGDALGAVKTGDIIRVTGSAMGTASAGVAFRVGMYITQDNGATYVLASPFASSTLPPQFPNTSGDRIVVPFSCAYVVTASPAPTFAGWSLRGQSASGALEVRVSNALVEVIRP